MEEGKGKRQKGRKEGRREGEREEEWEREEREGNEDKGGEGNKVNGNFIHPCIMIFQGQVSAATFENRLKIGAFSGHFTLEFGFPSPLWPSDWHFKCQNAGLSEGMIIIRQLTAIRNKGPPQVLLLMMLVFDFFLGIIFVINRHMKKQNRLFHQ